MDKKEFLHPHKLGAGLKLWEICANKVGGVLVYLLRQSSESGGGDQSDPNAKWVGHWAGDRVVVVGDYDESKLYQKAQGDFDEPVMNEQINAPYKDISLAVRKEYEKFLGEPLGERWDVHIDETIAKLKKNAKKKIQAGTI